MLQPMLLGSGSECGYAMRPEVLRGHGGRGRRGRHGKFWGRSGADGNGLLHTIFFFWHGSLIEVAVGLDVGGVVVVGAVVLGHLQRLAVHAWKVQSCWRPIWRGSAKLLECRRFTNTKDNFLHSAESPKMTNFDAAFGRKNCTVRNIGNFWLIKSLDL